MALSPRISWLLLSLLVAVTPVPCTCEDRARMAGSLLHCFDPEATALANASNSTESFRASLLPLLGALPSAAAPTGFAALRSDSGRAFVRGLCFNNNFKEPSKCLPCLSAAAKNLTAGCGAKTRRAGIWTSGCFVAYAGTDTSSATEDAFRELLFLSVSGSGNDTNTTTFYDDNNLHHMLVAIAQAVARRAAAEISGARMLATAETTTLTSVERGNYSYYVQSKVWVVAQCARDGAAPDCVRCLQDSARAVDWDLDAAGGVVADVAGFNCYLRFEVSTSSLGSPLNNPYIFMAVVIFVALLVQQNHGRLQHHHHL